MNGQNKKIFFPAFLMLLVFLSLTAIPLRGQQRIRRDIRMYAERLRENPEDVEALREIGVLCVHSHQFERGKRFLGKAYNLSPRDGKTLLYYGLAYEFQDSDKVALDLYYHYPEVYPGPYQQYVEGRYHHLSRKLIRKEIKDLLKPGATVADSMIIPYRIAVFPLYTLNADKVNQLYGKGLTEMLRFDLALVPQIQVVDRVRMQILMEEASLLHTDIPNLVNLAHISRLLGSGWSLSGTFDNIGESIISVNAYLQDVIHKQTPERFSSADMIDTLIDIEKNLVLDFIASMGITLTEEVKLQITGNKLDNIHTFYIFCQGLAAEAAGDYRSAASFYEKVNALDLRFQPCINRLRESLLLSRVDADKDILLREISPFKTIAVSRPSENNLIIERLKNISSNLGAYFVPSQDSRQSLEEAFYSGLDLGLDDLPEPPPPPGN